MLNDFFLRENVHVIEIRVYLIHDIALDWPRYIAMCGACSCIEIDTKNTLRFTLKGR